MFSGNSDPGAPGGGSNQQGGLFSGYFGGNPSPGMNQQGGGSSGGGPVNYGGLSMGGTMGPAGSGQGGGPSGGIVTTTNLGSMPGTLGPSQGGGLTGGAVTATGLGSAPGMLGSPAPAATASGLVPHSRPHFASDANPYGGLPPGSWRGDPGMATTLLGGTPIGTIPSPAPPNPFGGLDVGSPGIARTFLGGTPTGVMPSPSSNPFGDLTPGSWRSDPGLASTFLGGTPSGAIPSSTASSGSIPGAPAINNANNIGYSNESFFSPTSTNSGLIGQYGTPNSNDLPGSFLSQGMLSGGPPLQSNFVDPNVGGQNYSYNNVGPQSPIGIAQGPFDLSAPW